MKNSPIFVVGPSRSGTALMRSCLNQHPEIHIAGETHYFDDLRVELGGSGLEPLSESQLRRVEDYFLSLAHRPYGHGGEPHKSRVAARHLRSEAAALGVGGDAYFEAFCKLGATEGEHRWGEKTPRHVFRVDEISERYPAAQVICMVRDPRAVVASYRNWSHQGRVDMVLDAEHRSALADEEYRTSKSYDIRLTTLLWRSAVSAAVRARHRHGEQRVYIQRYEDLVRDPVGSMHVLAEWLGLRFDDRMLDVPIHNSSFVPFTARGGVSTEPVRRWEKTLSRQEVSTIETIARSKMRDFGYEFMEGPKHGASIAAMVATLPYAVMRAALANRTRIRNMPSYVYRRARLALPSRAVEPRG